MSSTAQAAAAQATPAAVVLDTNAALDWLVFDDPAIRGLSTAISQGSVRWLACPRMRLELAHMLSHASLARWRPDAAAALATFDRHVRLLDEPLANTPKRLFCTDPDDQVFIDLALEHQALWLVTHDRALLKLARKALLRGVKVLPPARWQIPNSAVLTGENG